MYCIGLTGTIASGKSAAIDYFKTQGIATLNADDIARRLTGKGSKALSEIVIHFGKDMLLPNGELDRRQLRQHIMRHPKDRQWLENLLHPMIRQEIERAITLCHGPYCVIEIPLLTDRKPYPYLNRVLLITAEPQQQIDRLIARDHCSEAEAIALLHHQEANNHRAALADDILVNTDTVETFNNQLKTLHQRYLNLANLPTSS